jgi:guanine deaminase
MRMRARLLTPDVPGTVRFASDAMVVVADGRIADVGPWDGGPVDEDLRPGVLMPGFVDAHVHYPQTRIVGRATGGLLDWLARSTFPEEERFADRAHAERVAVRFCAALAAAGTTRALVYGPVFARAVDVLLEVAERRGQAFVAGPVLMDDACPDALKVPVEPAMAALGALVEKWHGRSGSEIAVIPRFALSCTDGMLAAAGAFARERGLRVTTHLAETMDECRLAVARSGAADYLAVYERAGLVTPGAVFAHCIHLSVGEWERFAAAGAVVAHCPDSNDFLGSGAMPVHAARSRGILVGLGTDVAAGRSFRIPRIASAAYDNGLRTGAPWTPAELLCAATSGAPLGYADVGRIAPGYRADLTLFDPPDDADDVDGVLAALLFDHDAGPMQRTWVAGRVVHALR